MGVKFSASRVYKVQNKCASNHLKNKIKFGRHTFLGFLEVKRYASGVLLVHPGVTLSPLLLDRKLSAK